LARYGMPNDDLGMDREPIRRDEGGRLGALPPFVMALDRLRIGRESDAAVGGISCCSCQHLGGDCAGGAASIG
jgi:hypothetical protein